MRHRTRALARLAPPFRGPIHWLTYFLLIGIACGLLLLGRAEQAVMERLRAGIVDFVAPIMTAIARPMAEIDDAVSRVVELGRLRRENAELREQNARLLRWQAAARALSSENERFRALLRFVPEPSAHLTAARVIADPGRVFVRSVIVAAGARAGLRKGHAAVTGDGLAGRVVSVGARSARVLLLTDLNSRIPVVVERSRERAILAGDNAPRPGLLFLREHAAVKEGDRIVTSGHGGVLPPGLPVGVVSAVGGGRFRVRLNADLSRLEFLRILHRREVAVDEARRGAGPEPTARR